MKTKEWGALGTELSSEALTLRVFRVSKNRERQYINVWHILTSLCMVNYLRVGEEIVSGNL